MAKRTYSGYEKKREEARRKRQKSEEDGELRWPGNTPRAHQQQSSSLLKSFRGPVSFDMDSDNEDPGSPPRINDRLTSVFDRAQAGKLQPVKYKQNNNIYGSRKDFEKTMQARTSTRNIDMTTRSHLPTPPTESQKQQGQRLNKFFPELNGAAESLATHVTKPVWKREVAPKILKKSVKSDEPKQPYVPKQYVSEKLSVPQRDLSGNRLSSESKEIRLWTTNQSKSAFLRLPGEIRNRIYEYVLGGNTIKIGYETYRSKYKDDKLSESVPVFKYHCTVFDQRVNPCKDRQQSDVEVTTDFILLNNVCRQLYLETAGLLFKLNRIAFESYKIMFNFIGYEQRLSRQQRHSLSEMLVGDDLPGANILTCLPNLEKVFLAGVDQIYKRIQDGKPKGWYLVIRPEGEEPKLQLINRSAHSV